MQFISPISNSKIDDGLQDEGNLGVVRLDFNIWKGAKYRQGNLKGLSTDNVGLTLSLALYDWDNKKDVVEIEHSDGAEVALAFRGYGLSVDVEYNDITAHSPFTLIRPLFANGQAAIEQFSIEAGYLIFNNQLEIIASQQSMKADTWINDWEIWEVGANYFFDGHKHKVQLSYRDEKNVKGKLVDESGLFLQWQYDF